MILIDTNLLILLVVGLTNPDYIQSHRRTRDDYTTADFDLVFSLYERSDDIVFLPHVLTEVSNLTARPERTDIRRTLRRLVEVSTELQVESHVVVSHSVFERLGLADAAIFHVCTQDASGQQPTLLTADEALANVVRAYGGDVLYLPDLCAERAKET